VVKDCFFLGTDPGNTSVNKPVDICSFFVHISSFHLYPGVLLTYDCYNKLLNRNSSSDNFRDWRSEIKMLTGLHTSEGSGGESVPGLF
jgi:hypothetical protein